MSALESVMPACAFASASASASVDAVSSRFRLTIGGGASILLLGVAAAGFAANAQAQASDTPMPYYNAAQVLQGLYGVHLPTQASAFVQSAAQQTQAIAGFCANTPQAGKATTPDALRQQWQATVQQWLKLATPTVGPLVSRRSLRQIDFTPTRPQAIERAIQKAPKNAADMELVGTPAKGFGALDWLLGRDLKPGTPACSYAVQVAQAIAVEAQGIATDLAPLKDKTWAWAVSSDEGDAASETAAGETAAAMAEWVNQWLGGLERLRWAQMEKPIQSVEGTNRMPPFARVRFTDNVTEWHTQWQALHAQAVLSAAQRQTPPAPGRDLIPIEALLLSKGQMPLAQRWRQAVAQADAAMRAINGPEPRKVLAAAAQLKSLTAMYQADVAPALNIPLGFSDADGD